MYTCFPGSVCSARASRFPLLSLCPAVEAWAGGCEWWFCAGHSYCKRKAVLTSRQSGQPPSCRGAFQAGSIGTSEYKAALQAELKSESKGVFSFPPRCQLDSPFGNLGDSNWFFFYTIPISNLKTWVGTADWMPSPFGLLLLLPFQRWDKQERERLSLRFIICLSLSQYCLVPPTRPQGRSQYIHCRWGNTLRL